MAEPSGAGAVPHQPVALTGAETGLGDDVWLAGDGVRLHAVARGGGPPVVLLHGFPDCWYGWRHQLPALDAAGFAAVAIDLRGYNLSDRPPGVLDYHLTRVVDDVAAAVASLGRGPACVVGHDWGGATAWQLAARYPELVSRLAVLNAPHPRRFPELLRSPRQALRSWYIAAVQVPAVPELVLGARGERLLLATLRAMHHRPDALTECDLERYRAVFAGRGALTAALNYYRAAARRPAEEVRLDRPVRQPTLVLWGQEDPALLPENADGLEAWVPDVRVERFPGAGHFVQADAHEGVNASLVRFLQGA